MCNIEIKVAILRSGRKGYQIAQNLDWHPTRISQIISGVYTPSHKEKRELAEALNTTVPKLFSEQYPPVAAQL